MSSVFPRLLWILFFAFLGHLTAALWIPSSHHPATGAAAGAGLGALAVLTERILARHPLRSLLGGLVGLVAGLLVLLLLQEGLVSVLSGRSEQRSLLVFALGLLLGSLGWTLGFRKAREWSPDHPFRMRKEESEKRILLFDTSVIIDGRIADVCESGFLRETVVIPQFILKELQQIADSSDPLKRARGRRGLDILRKIQEQRGMEVQILDREFPRIHDVDSKLVQLSKELACPIITNDFNLNKVAELQGIRVLNVNQLANAMRPVFLPGEFMRVRMVKEGKEEGQGVGYLDDGTMVVVDSARRHMGKTIDVTVTSVLQTTAGRMIFAAVREEAELQAQNVRG